MIVQTLQQEFEQEVNNTRKLLLHVPDKDIMFKPSSISWTMGELAQHIATIYYWYVGALTMDVYNLAEDSVELKSPSNIKATLDLFEKNVALARTALKSITEESLQTPWTMKTGDQIVLGPLPRVSVVRGFLFNHIYHHRGELVVYLRSTGNKVPGLYGPTYEQSQKEVKG